MLVQRAWLFFVSAMACVKINPSALSTNTFSGSWKKIAGHNAEEAENCRSLAVSFACPDPYNVGPEVRGIPPASSHGLEHQGSRLGSVLTRQDDRKLSRRLLRERSHLTFRVAICHSSVDSSFLHNIMERNATPKRPSNRGLRFCDRRTLRFGETTFLTQ